MISHLPLSLFLIAYEYQPLNSLYYLLFYLIYLFLVMISLTELGIIISSK